MEEQIKQLGDITVTPLMLALAIPVTFAIQFIKALVGKWNFFSADEIKKSLFPLVGIAITIMAYYFAGIENWMLAGVVMGLAASGGYDAFSGASRLTNIAKPN